MGATTASLPTVLTTARLFDLVEVGRNANPGAPLVIRGERGVGKDTLARLLHDASPRWPHAFIKVNCSAQPPGHHEAELFGHERGASALATRRRLGGFEFANNGTLYLDEIGAVSRALVPRLLRVLNTGEVRRCGGDESIHVDVRFIASTVQSISTRVDDDLWLGLRRLNAVEIWIPPLRQRIDEIPIFASFFLDRFNRWYRQDVQLGSDLIAGFQARPWPGNLRELAETVHQLVARGARAQWSASKESPQNLHSDL